MAEELLRVEDLRVSVEGREILKGVSLSLPIGETHILFGPNGSGKSTLLAAIMGLPWVKVESGRIIFKGQDITHLGPHERARLGIGLAFQRPPRVRGVRLGNLLRRISEDGVPLELLAQELRMSEHLGRELNHGFSGGEMKRSEILQLLVQRPLLSLLDEPESGVDIENVALLGEAISRLLDRHHPKSPRRSGLIVTHTGFILDYVSADKGYILMDGKIECWGNPYTIFKNIKEHGFEGCRECPMRNL